MICAWHSGAIREVWSNMSSFCYWTKVGVLPATPIFTNKTIFWSLIFLAEARSQASLSWRSLVARYALPTITSFKASQVLQLVGHGMVKGFGSVKESEGILTTFFVFQFFRYGFSCWQNGSQAAVQVSAWFPFEKIEHFVRSLALL